MDPERRARWRELVAKVDPETAAHGAAWEPAPPTWMFMPFGPTGAGVEPFFPDTAAGKASARRLRRAFASAPQTSAAYLVPGRRRVRADLAIRHARTYLARLRALVPRAVEARELEADEPGVPWLDPDTIELGREPIPEPASPDDTNDGDHVLYTLGAWYARGHDDHELLEPLYGLACDYHLASYVLTPLVDPRGRDRDPFASWFWLWRHGHEVRLLDAGGCVVVPSR